MEVSDMRRNILVELIRRNGGVRHAQEYFIDAQEYFGRVVP